MACSKKSINTTSSISKAMHQTHKQRNVIYFIYCFKFILTLLFSRKGHPAPSSGRDEVDDPLLSDRLIEEFGTLRFPYWL